MPKKMAAQATAQIILNSYLRETANYRMEKTQEVSNLSMHLNTTYAVICPMERHQLEIIAPVQYRSATQRHIYQFPLYYRSTGKTQLHPLDYVTMATIMCKELALEQGLQDFPDELLYRMIQSKQYMEHFLNHRKEDRQELYQSGFTFLQAEQSLLFGHLLHPTSKSRQGLSEQELDIYSPEQKGRFSLHYFQVDKNYVREDSILPQSATKIIKEMLLADPDLPNSWKHQYMDNEQYSIIPLHPIQAKHVLQKDEIQQLIQQGVLIDLGIQGREYYPTSSVRTLYHPEVPYMLKGSLHLKITNSVRLNLRKELDRGVEIAEILQGKVGQELVQRYPFFTIITDPAYITLDLPGMEESGFEMVIRENPFSHGQDQEVTLLAGLCQDPIPGERSRLASIMHQLARLEGRSVKEVSLDWFQQYLDIALTPILWLHLHVGIALEAHQQNSLIRLHNGYPQHFYYRDNQGYYYSESTFARLQEEIPHLNQKSDTRCADEVADGRLRYYLFFNHLFGLINAFGVADLVEEEHLLDILRSHLITMRSFDRPSSILIDSLLSEETLPCKSNLLTRLHDMDELVGPMESQSVYVDMPNPLYKKEEIECLGK